MKHTHIVWENKSKQTVRRTNQLQQHALAKVDRICQFTSNVLQ
jgi:hypothetical protein